MRTFKNVREEIEYLSKLERRAFIKGNDAVAAKHKARIQAIFDGTEQPRLATKENEG